VLSPFHIVIPARLSSTRLPEKPLVDVAGKPLVVRVWEAAARAGAASVWVATDSAAIAEVVTAAGGSAILTSPTHPSGTDRLAEVAATLGWPDETIVVNWQGDEPLLPAALVQEVAQALAQRPEAAMATAAVPVATVAEWRDPNAVKVVCNAAGFAAYFSRAPIPWLRDVVAAELDPGAPPPVPVWRHLGLYAYRVGFLRRFVAWPVTPWEGAEQLEQLRALWYGERIFVHLWPEAPPAGVDTVADLDRVRTVFTAI